MVDCIVDYGILISVGLLAYFVYALLVYGLLRIYLKAVKNDTFLDHLLRPTMFLLLVSTFPFLFLIWLLDWLVS